MPSYKLTYFDLRFRPEVVRLMFHVKGIPFEDVRLSMVNREELAKLKENGVLPLGHIPTLEVDGRVLVQSRAIMRFVAREFGMYGSNNAEARDIDEITETVDDLIENACPWWYKEKDPVKKEESRKNYLEVKGPLFLSFLEKKLEKSSSGFIVGSGLTVADLAVCNIVDILTDTMSEVVAPFTKLVAHKVMIQGMDAVASYLKVRPKTAF